MFLKGICVSIIMLSLALFAADEKPLLTFAHVGDTHIGSGEASHNGKILLSAIDSINKNCVNFTIVTGDLVNQMEYLKYEELFQALNRLDSGYYLVPGNHDVGMIPSEQSLTAYRNIVGEDYYSFSVGSTLCIVVNSQLWVNEKENSSKEMDRWLKSALEAAHKKHDRIFIFGHMPLFIENYDEPTIINNNIPLLKRRGLLTLFQKYKVNAVFTAHLHRYLELEHKNILFSSVEPISVELNEPDGNSGLRIRSVYPDSLKSTFIDLVDNVLKTQNVLKKDEQ